MDEIDRIINNLEILRKARRSCTCDLSEPHYHELLSHDDESGNEYLAETDDEHHVYVAKLERELEKLQRKRR